MDLSDFDVHGPLGEGGLGEVLSATEKGSGRAVVLKRPKSPEQQGYQRARDEGRLGLRLNGTAFVETLGLFDVSGVPHVALERIEGVTVMELWRRTGPLSSLGVARIGADVCQALAIMHVLRDDDGNPLGALHRDISSRNVMVDAQGRVRIIDLGAAFTAGGDRSAVSRAGVVIGTLSYLPPEIFEGGGDSPARDMWSVGVMLLEAAVGNVFSKKKAGEGTIDGLKRVRRKTMDPFSDPAVLSIDPRLLAVLKQLLTRDPALRMDAKTASAEFAAMCAGHKPDVELARRVARSRDLPKPVTKPREEQQIASPPSILPTASRTHADGPGFEDDGPTIQEPPRRFDTGDTGDVGEEPTRRDRSGLTPAGVVVTADGPSGIARPWPKSPPPPPSTEHTFLGLLTEPESDGGVFAGEAAFREGTDPTTLGVAPMPVQTPPARTEIVRRPPVGGAEAGLKPSHVRLFPWKGAVSTVLLLAGALWLLLELH